MVEAIRAAMAEVGMVVAPPVVTEAVEEDVVEAMAEEEEDVVVVATRSRLISDFLLLSSFVFTRCGTQYSIEMRVCVNKYALYIPESIVVTQLSRSLRMEGMCLHVVG